MALTQTGTDGIKDDAITLAKQAAGTDGQIITYDASGNPVAVGPGTDGQVLTSTGAGSPPAFEDIPAGGAALTGSTNNQITTVTGANAIQGEANLTFDGTNLGIGSTVTRSGLTVALGGNSVPSAGSTDGAAVFGNALGDAAYGLVCGATSSGSGYIQAQRTDGTASTYDLLMQPNGGNIGFNRTNVDAGDSSTQTSTATPKRIVFNNDYSNGYTDASLKVYLFNDGTTRQGFTSGPAYDIQYHTSGSATGKHSFYVANTKVVDLDSDGLKFNGDTAAANALDDYETGSWTPTLTRSGADATVSYNFQSGKYTKIGNLVMMWFDINVASESGGSGGWRLSVPFTFAVGGSHGGYGAANFRDSSLFGRLNMADASSYIDSTYLGLAYVNSSGNEVSAVSTGSGRLTGMTWAYTS